MNYFSLKNICLTIPFLLLAFVACKKNVAGPQGDAGTNGGKGNMKETERTFTIAATSWTTNGAAWTVPVYAPEITNDVISKGEVKVYMKNSNQWWSLPYGVGDIFMEQNTEVGYLYLKYSKIHGGPPLSPGIREFRLVTMAPVN
jgi:hypothetical protein